MGLSRALVGIWGIVKAATHAPGETSRLWSWWLRKAQRNASYIVVSPMLSAMFWVQYATKDHYAWVLALACASTVTGLVFGVALLRVRRMKGGGRRRAHDARGLQLALSRESIHISLVEAPALRRLCAAQTCFPRPTLSGRRCAVASRR